MTAVPLFIAEPTFTKRAGIDLSPDPSQWEVEVTRHVHEKLPFVATHPIKVAFEKVDDKLGFGTGSLTIGSEGQNKVSAPLLVREFELLPVDVFIKAGSAGMEPTYIPLNEDRLEEALFDTHMFAGGVPPQESSGGYANNYPPHSGKYVYASAQEKQAADPAVPAIGQKPQTASGSNSWLRPRKGTEFKGAPPGTGTSAAIGPLGATPQKPISMAAAMKMEKAGTGSLLDAIGHTVSETDKKHFLDKLASDDSLRAVYQDRGLLGTVRKIAAMGRPESAPGVRPVHKALTPNVIQITKLGYDRFLVRAVSDRLYMPIEHEMNGDEVIAKFGSDVHTHILDNNEYSTVQGRTPAAPVALEGLTSELKQLDTYCRCEVRTLMSDRVAGWLFPKVVNLDGSALGKDKLFTDTQEIYAMQEDIAGREILESFSLPEDPPSHEIEMGVTGIFHFKDDKGRAFCTVPVTITSPVCDMGDYLYMQACTELGETYTLEISSAVETLTASRRKKYTVMVPAKMRFSKTGRSMQKLQDNPDLVVKFAQETLKDKGVLEVRSDNDGQNFSFAGTGSDYLEGG